MGQDSKEVHIYHADAGSGKTSLLMDIISKHVQEGVPLNRVALVTFTRAAAEVAKQRICERMGVNQKDAPHFRTIHSMCFQHLGMSSNRMMDTEKYEDFGTKSGYVFGRMGGKRTLEDVDWVNMNDAQIAAFEQLYRNNNKQAQWLLDNKIDNMDFARYCREYVRYKDTFDYKDFTDLLESYIERDLYEDVDVACIDEAQDCTPLQWQVLFKAFRNARYVYVVGDEKQAIYGFNGSDSSILLHLRGHQHSLDSSWRVPTKINQFVKDHIVSDMRDITATSCDSRRQGGAVHYIVNMDEFPPMKNSKTYMFLARNKKFLRSYMDWCETYCIPYNVLGVPLFSAEEKRQFRDNDTSEWEPEKLLLAQRYFRAGTFYSTKEVRIDTIHGVKGDEADVVVLLPDLSRLTWKDYDQDPNNEHRVFYVACTRARETLYILDPVTKFHYAYLF